ncbi:MAG: hypothetical protein ABIA76_04335 [Candidatus Diapherotrites archaeon]
MIPKEAKALVLERIINYLPEDAKLMVANESSITKKELIEHVKKMDLVGKEYIEMELLYLRNIVKRHGAK